MGGSASIHIHPPHITHSYFKELLSSRAKRNELFDDIASRNHGHIALKNKLNINQLSSFFIDSKNANMSDFPVDVDCLLTALKKCSKKKPHDHLTRKEFHVFLPTLFLYSKLRVIFKEMDGAVVQDNKIFKGEFIKWRHCLSNVDGIEIGAECTDEVWASEFDSLDSIKKDGHITFHEFCKYSLDHLTKTDKFIEEFMHPDEEDDHEVDEAAMDGAIEHLVVHDLQKVNGEPSPRGSFGEIIEKSPRGTTETSHKEKADKSPRGAVENSPREPTIDASSSAKTATDASD